MGDQSGDQNSPLGFISRRRMLSVPLVGLVAVALQPLVAPAAQASKPRPECALDLIQGA